MGLPLHEKRRVLNTGRVGLIATYFIATPAEAKSIDLDSGPTAAMETVDGAVLMPDDLSSLAEHLGCQSRGYELVASTDDAWLIRVDDDCMKTLARLPTPIGDETADEFNLSSDETDLLETVLQPMAARVLASHGRAIYEWISL